MYELILKFAQKDLVGFLFMAQGPKSAPDRKMSFQLNTIWKRSTIKSVLDGVSPSIDLGKTVREKIKILKWQCYQ